MQRSKAGRPVTLLYHGTDNFNAQKILQDGAIIPDVNKWNMWSAHAPEKELMQDDPGYVYLTPFLDTAKYYAILKATYYRTKKFHAFYADKFEVLFTKHDADCRPNSTPAVLELEIPASFSVSIDPRSMAGIRVFGKIDVKWIRNIIGVRASDVPNISKAIL